MPVSCLARLSSSWFGYDIGLEARVVSDERESIVLATEAGLLADTFS